MMITSHVEAAFAFVMTFTSEFCRKVAEASCNTRLVKVKNIMMGQHVCRKAGVAWSSISTDLMRQDLQKRQQSGSSGMLLIQIATAAGNAIRHLDQGRTGSELNVTALQQANKHV